MPRLTLSNISKTFDRTTVLHDLSLTVMDGELLTLLGPSGCGKSTTLWSIAGLHQPSSGSISFGERVVFDHGRVNIEPEGRNCGVVFQSYAIWPHMSVFDNVAYPLKLRKVPKPERRRRVMEVLELVELGAHSKRYPHELSGGQQQRVALARALAHPPDMLLLDEPFSNLDAKLRDRSREWLKTLQSQINVTTVFVTHDQDEALSMSDRIVVMNKGVIRQIGTPTEIYDQPADLFVADFIGIANQMPATIVEADGTYALVTLPGVEGAIRVPHRGSAIGPVQMSIRPERIDVHRDAAPGHTAPNIHTAKIEASSYLGDHYRYVIQLGDAPLTVLTTRRVDSAELTVELPTESIRLFYPEVIPENEEKPHVFVR